MEKQISLSKLIILNFKGIRNLSIDFTAKETHICGGNGTGKTSVLDAFLWCLFGKDSTNRSDTNFNIKTIGSDGKPILKLDHEVTAVINVNGREISLRRCYKEKWGSGSNAGKLMNHYTEFYLNDVKLGTKKEYDYEVSEIIPEDVFRMVTNPLYFPNLPSETQKNLLLDMAGDVSDEYIASLKPEFVELMSSISGRTLEQFKKELSAKKKAVNEELKGIPGRIDEVNRSMPEDDDWDEIENILEYSTKRLSDIEEQIIDASKVAQAENERKISIQRLIGDKKLERSNLENSIKNSINNEANEADNSIRNIDYEIKSLTGDITRLQRDNEDIKKRADYLNTVLDTLRAKFKEINAEQINISSDEFICPTCKRSLEVADIDAKQRELEANFNQRKSEKLQSNTSEGRTKVAEKEELTLIIEKNLLRINECEEKIITLKGRISEIERNKPESKDPMASIKSNPDWIKIGNEIADLENQLLIDAPISDNTSLREEKSKISIDIDDLKARKMKRTVIENSRKRIEQLEDMKAKNNQALADLERLEFIALDFQKSKDSELHNRINGMFQIVSFSFVSEQLNGNEKVTCVASVDGTPYPDVNNAGKINAGLDIINAICRNKGITAPIFIDNRESVNNLIPTMAQIINLSVSNHTSLMMRTNAEPVDYVELKKI